MCLFCESGIVLMLRDVTIMLASTKSFAACKPSMLPVANSGALDVTHFTLPHSLVMAGFPLNGST